VISQILQEVAINNNCKLLAGSKPRATGWQTLEIKALTVHKSFPIQGDIKLTLSIPDTRFICQKNTFK
jgi:hypothetical protein